MRRYEYSVVVQRDGGRVHRKRYLTEKGAQRRLALYGPEPWRAYERHPDDLFCCDGSMCSCGGITVREESEARRAQMPRLMFARIERRQVGEWQAIPTKETPNA